MPYHGQSVTAPSGLYTAEVRVGGTRQDIYQRDLNKRFYVAAVPGTAWTLQVANRGHGRIEVLVSVDGRDIHKDQAADLTSSTGLVIPAGGSYEFDGFREDDETTREFVFGSVEGSLAQRAGDDANTGVIGIAAYREKLPETFDSAALRRSYGGPQGQSVTYGGLAKGGLTTNTVERGSMATHIGGRQDSKVGRTSFERSGPPETVIIGYGTVEELKAWGAWGPRDPDPFPGRQAPTGYGRY